MSSSRDIARLKSYTGSAVLTFILYLFLFFPGLIANWLFYNDAKRMEDIAGESLPGVGCLTIQLYVAVGAFVIGAIVFFVIAVSGSLH